MTTIIAECCQNHNGDLNLLKEMIWAAKESGATYVKIQSMLASELTYREQFETGHIENSITKVMKRPYQAEYDRLKPMDLNDETHHWFVEECHKAGIKPLTTAFTRSRVLFLSTLSWPAIKVASYDCASFPMIRELKDNFERLFISTGATTDDEIKKTAEILQGHSFTFLHCVTIYPTPLDQLHLSRMEWLKLFTPSIGFSDHTLVERDGLKASFGALALGADVIERHFTLLKKDQSKDGPVSINPKQLKNLVVFSKLSQAEQQRYVALEIPEWPMMQGKSIRPLSHEELLNRDYYHGRFASNINGQIIYNWEDK